MNPNDPVEEFFDRERSSVQPLPTDDAHWTSIVEAHRRARRSRWTGYLAGAAAAVVLVGGLGWALRPQDDSHATMPASRTTTVAPTPSGTTAPPTTPSGSPSSSPTSVTSSGATTLPVPQSFRVVSVSNPGHDTLFALGTTSCRGSACQALARSLDGGRTWRLVASFPGTTPTGHVTGHPGTSTSFTQVRFASPKVGWVFGGAVKQTTDGGLTWHAYPHAGKGVLDLSTDGTNVVVVSGDEPCDGTQCGTSLTVQFGPVSATSAGTVVAEPAGVSGSAAPIEWRQGTAFVSLASGRSPTLPLAVSSSGSREMKPACPALATDAVPDVRIVAPASGTGLFATCVSGGAAGSIGYAVSSSSDGGTTWRPVSGPPLLLVNAGVSSFAASGSDSLVAVSGGSTSLHGAMKVSADGGVSWHTPAAPPPLPDRGWAWVGSPGGDQYYVVPVDGAGVYWTSTDAGEHWQQVRVAG